MGRIHSLLLSASILAASTSLSVEAATDAERIRTLEQQLKQQQTEMQQQQRLLQEMNSELQRLKVAQPIATAEVAAGGKSEARARPPNTLSANIYGFARADMTYDFKRVDPDWEDTLRVSTIPTESGAYGSDGDFNFSVRQSRLGIKGSYGEDVTFMLEGELFGVGGDAGQTTPRLRHAWATYKNFGMGQTWSNFMDADIFPNTVDYWGPTGMVFYRNKQARYTFPMGEDEFSISFEDPDTALTTGQFRDTSGCDLPDPAPDCESTGTTGSDIFKKHNDIPDFTARYRNNGDFGHFQVAGIVRKLGYERLDTGKKDDEIGWGINASTGLNTWGRDVLKLQLAYGEGIGNYMNDGGVDLAPDSADIDHANAKAVELVGISAYYDHYWNDRWATSLGWSMTDLDTTDGQSGTEFKRGQIATINMLYYPRDNVMLGTEFNWGEREDVNGETGTDYRIQFSLQVNFDTGELLRP